MHLHEEYFTRHSIDAPFIKIPQKTTLIFRARSKFREMQNAQWAIFQIKKVQEVNYHPCYFVFKLCAPLHDGGDHPHPVHNIMQEKKVFFEDYELEILRYGEKVIDLGLEPIESLAEAKIAAWEIFLFCNDYRLDRIPIRLRGALWDSINKNASINERMLAQEEVIKGLQYEPTLSARWQTIKEYCDPLNYADWYAKIIRNITSKYLSTFSDIKNIA